MVRASVKAQLSFLSCEADFIRLTGVAGPSRRPDRQIGQDKKRQPGWKMTRFP